ncbi:MAG: hypothetical protein AB7L13_11145 [Acidimicrobiia bacterium]
MTIAPEPFKPSRRLAPTALLQISLGRENSIECLFKSATGLQTETDGRN